MRLVSSLVAGGIAGSAWQEHLGGLGRPEGGRGGETVIEGRSLDGEVSVGSGGGVVDGGIRLIGAGLDSGSFRGHGLENFVRGEQAKSVGNAYDRARSLVVGVGMRTGDGDKRGDCLISVGDFGVDHSSLGGGGFFGGHGILALDGLGDGPGDGTSIAQGIGDGDVLEGARGQRVKSRLDDVRDGSAGTSTGDQGNIALNTVSMTPHFAVNTIILGLRGGDGGNDGGCNGQNCLDGNHFAGFAERSGWNSAGSERDLEAEGQKSDESRWRWC